MKKKLILILFLTLCNQYVFSMAARFNAFATKASIGAFLFPEFARGIGNCIISQQKIDELRGLRKVDFATDKFVRDTLVEAHYPQEMVDSISVRTGQSLNRYAADSIRKIIYVPYAEKSRENFVIVDVFQPSTQARLCLIHEGGHINHWDNQRKIAAGLGLTIFIQGVSIGAAKLIRALVNRPFPVLSGMVKLSLGLPLKYLTRFGASGLLSQQCEKEADFEVIKRTTNSKDLHAFANFLEKHDKEVLNGHRWGNKYPNLAFFMLDNQHPRSLKRAEYFRQAAQDLEKEARKPWYSIF